MVNYDTDENTLDNKRARMAESHLVPIRENRQTHRHKLRHINTHAYDNVSMLSHASNINDTVRQMESDPISRMTDLVHLRYFLSNYICNLGSFLLILFCDMSTNI